MVGRGEGGVQAGTVQGVVCRCESGDRCLN